MTQYVSSSSSIYYYIRLYPHQIDHNLINYYWNNIDAEVEDGVVIVGGEGGVDITSAHQKQ